MRGCYVCTRSCGVQKRPGSIGDAVVREDAGELWHGGGTGCAATAHQGGQSRHFVRLLQREIVGSQDRQSRGGTQTCGDTANDFYRTLEFPGFLIDCSQGKTCLRVPRVQFMHLQVRNFSLFAPPLKNAKRSKITIGSDKIRTDYQDALEERLGFRKALLLRPDYPQQVNRPRILRLARDNFPKLLFRGVDLSTVN